MRESIGLRVISVLVALRGLLPDLDLDLWEFTAESRGQSDAESTLKTGAGIASASGLVVLIRDYLIGGPIYAGAIEIVDAIQGFGTNLVGVFSAWFQGLADVIGSIFRGDIIDTGAEISMGSLGEFGILGFVVAIAVTFGGMWIGMLILRRYDWSPIGSIYDRVRD